MAGRSYARAVDAAADAWVRAIGPLTDKASLPPHLSGASRPLALRSGSGQVVFPHWALEEDIAGALTLVMRRLPDALVSGWTVASWLCTPEPELGGQRPLDALRADRTEEVLLVAEYWSGQLQR